MLDPKTLNIEDKRQLLDLARETISLTIKNRRFTALKISHPKFSCSTAVFVTLWKNHQLRGCVGQTKAVYPLNEAITSAAYSAAFEDPRFRPVEEKELDEINIEISILSPLQKIDNTDKIKLGTHGVYVIQGHRAGIFLPEVVTRTGWSKEEFLSHLCRDKAGLSPEAWKDPSSELYIFTVTVFSDEGIRKKMNPALP